LLCRTQLPTGDGVLEGTAEEGGIRLFRSVPFAEPPVGDLRWKPLQPPKDWAGRKYDPEDKHQLEKGPATP